MNLKILFTGLISLICFSIIAQPGQLDPTFGLNGITTGPFTSNVSEGNQIAIQADGKLVTTGYLFDGSNQNFFIVRYNTDGTFDSTFGINGVIIDSVFSTNDMGRCVEIQSDGKIIISGTFKNPNNRDVFLKRYNTNGAIDSTFGINGITTTDFNNNTDDVPNDMIIQPDGKILVFGFYWFNINDLSFMLLRYNVDGTIDSTFGSSGRVSNGNGSGFAILLQPDGKIVCGGQVNGWSGDQDILIIRYESDGSVDTSFGFNGGIQFDIAQEDDRLYSVAMQSDGKILAGGSIYDGQYKDLIIRLDTTGHLDLTFQNSGFLMNGLNGINNWINSLMIQHDGKIISAGRDDNSNWDISLTRYNMDGTIDVSFGVLGYISQAIGLENDQVYSALLQPDNKIVVTGFYTDSGTTNLFTARFLNDSISSGIKVVEEINWNVFPQPAQTEINLPDIPGMKEITITDMNGRIVFHEVNPLPILNIRELESGIYFIRINNIVRKFVKM